MPQAAVATGCVDFVLPPERIAAELVRIGRHPYIADAASAAEGRTPAGDEERFGAILAILHGATGIDFSLYREKMVKRRILRRLALRNIGSLAEYCKRLENDPDELAALQRDLLIGVTSFFRDPGSFESLKRVVFPRILQGRPANAPIRVWVPGCATGEEAFSIAISLQEYLKETGAAFPVQIFASDISLAAIEKARGGRYLENIAADLTPERLNRCFTKIEGGGYQVNKNLREMCVFTRHNLIDDPPFSKLDLISCRNVLIYLGSVQKRHHPAVPLRAQANRVSHVGPIGKGGGPATCFRWWTASTGSMPGGKRRGSRTCFTRPAAGRAGRRRRTAAAPAAAGIVGRRGRAKRGRSHTPVEVQPGRSGGGRGPGGDRDSRQGQPLPQAADWKGELQSDEADPGYGTVSGSRKADPAGAAERRAGAAGARALRTRGHRRRVERGGGAVARRSKAVDAGPFRTRAGRRRTPGRTAGCTSERRLSGTARSAG